MAENLSIESPDFDRIKKGDNHATEDAIRLLWFVLNDEMKKRRTGDRRIEQRLSPKLVTFAPSGNINNVDLDGAGLVVYTGASSVDVTGYRAPGEDGDIIFVLVTGAGTITHKSQSASSDSFNRFVFQGAADVAVTTNKALVFIYSNARWREMKLA